MNPASRDGNTHCGMAWAVVLLATLVVLVAWLVADSASDGSPVGAPAPLELLSGDRPDAWSADEQALPVAPDDVVALVAALTDAIDVSHLLPGRPHERTVLLQPDLCTVRGRVLSPEGMPVAGADVAFYELERGHAPWTGEGEHRAVTDAEGRFEVSDVSRWQHEGETRRDDWIVSIRADGYGLWHGVPVAAGASEDVVLPPAETVRLSLRFEGGAPVVGARVREYTSLLTHWDDGRTEWCHWGLGESDRDGRLTFALTAKDPRPLVAVDHPDHRGTHRLPEGDDVTLTLPVGRAIAPRWVGDHAAWEARGLEPPELTLQFAETVFRATHSPDHARHVYTRRMVDGMPVFEHLSGAPVALVDDEAQQILFGPHEPAPGRHPVDVLLPELPPFVPGETPWGFGLQVVDAEGAVQQRYSMDWGRLPALELVAADGRTESIRRRKTIPSRVVTSLPPPVTVRFGGWPLGPRVDDVGPGGDARLIVDGERLDEWSGTVRLDRAGLDPVRTETLHLKVDLGATEGGSRGTNRGRLRGVPPGRWLIDVSGPGIVRDRREHELTVGQELVLVPGIAPLPGPEPRTEHEEEAAQPDPDAHPLLAPGQALLTGTVALAADPLSTVTALLLAPPELDRALALAGQFEARHEGRRVLVRGGAFGQPVPAGTWRVLALAGWDDDPGATRGWGADLHRAVRRAQWVEPEGAPVVTLTEGESTSLALRVALDQDDLGTMLVELTLDGGPVPSSITWREPTRVEGTWTLDDGRAETLQSIVYADRLLLRLPAGSGRLVLAFDSLQANLVNGGRPASGAAEVTLVPGAVHQATRVALDLVSRGDRALPPEPTMDQLIELEQRRERTELARRPPPDSRSHALKSQLGTLRQSLQMYALGHDGNWSTDPARDLVAEPTEEQKALGVIGPLLGNGVPSNAVSGSSTVRLVEVMPDEPEPFGGWVYCTTTGEIRADVAGEGRDGSVWFEL